MKDVLLEVLGVPPNILDSARKLYDEFAKSVYNEVEHTEDSKTYNFVIESDTKMNVGEYEIDRIDIELDIIPLEVVKEIDIISMGIKSQSKKPTEKKPYKGKIITDVTNPKISVKIVTPEIWDIKDLYNYIRKSKIELTSSFSHELKHLYDDKKKKWQYLKPTTRYIAAQSTSRFGIEPLDKFAHIIYYTHVVENLVRTTEVLSQLEDNNISKKEFLNFLLDNRTYQDLKEYQKFSTEKLKEDIKENYMERAKEILDKINVDYSEMSENEMVNEILRIWYVNFVNADIEAFSDAITSNFLEKIMGFSGNKEKVFFKHISDVTKFQNRPLDFYRFEENKIKRITGEMLKKIHKLYSLLPDNENNNISKLHQKITSKK
jgi:hypothetical protein